MIKLTTKNIADITSGELYGKENQVISEIAIDSRKINPDSSKLFIALKGERRNGHHYIHELYKQGVRNFLVSDFRTDFQELPGSNFIVTADSLTALHQLAEYAGKLFSKSITAITGSNGKTGVKEWLFSLLSPHENIIRSPKSYNSQVGVPLSMLLLEDKFDRAIIEAGISQPDEMFKLEKIIQPDIGIFTGIGDAHKANFINEEQHISEKLLLFKNCSQIIYQNNQSKVNHLLKKQCSEENLFTWGKSPESTIQITPLISEQTTKLLVKFKNQSSEYIINYTDKASIENAGHCIAYIYSQNLDHIIKKNQFRDLQRIEMRMEQIEGKNNCTLINDSYNSDINSLTIALDLLKNQGIQDKKTVILSDILQCKKNKPELYRRVAGLLSKTGIHRLIGIGKEMQSFKTLFSEISRQEYFTTTEEFIEQFSIHQFSEEAVLIKGARKFAFERISELLQKKKHQTQLKINLSAMVHNLNFFRSELSSGTRTMAMVKAFSYGSGSHEIVKVLEHEQIDYLGVAITDEGVKLRNEGIQLPILVLNPETSSFRELIKRNLEPEIYNFSKLNSFLKAAESLPDYQPSIHLKFETGMNRLGFEEADTSKIIKRIQAQSAVKIKSVFSHLAGSDDPAHDEFTKSQISRFSKISNEIRAAFSYPILRHLLNSSGIERFPEAKFDMVRLGIGLYGFSPNNQDKLKNVSSLISSISQIRPIKAGESVGYGRAEFTNRDSTIAVVPIGYADGLHRSLSRGNWQFIVNGKPAPVIGNICMDMTMINVTGIDVAEGDRVTIFGNKQTAGHMAEKLNTIPYEIITGIGSRVKRVYYH
ncbi:MAG: bifunctional UDP-N-acetylmuramoyl-tripeptide:D-alanyl-D-alanine ligase/alanine racemase [Bacteroidota bacterium]|nr:bifunctional UDP-N-acetylmuramoyl-tripeptide:D-alanyl-D-alanine ligase/alanine racemase [Bacteroidota bacterium]